MQHPCCPPGEPERLGALVFLGRQREELVPYYVRRALGGYPARTPLAGLAAGYEAMAGALPPGSPVLLFALQRLAQRAQQALSAPSAHGPQAQPGLDLIGLYAHLLLIIDFQVCTSLKRLSGSPKAGLHACLRTLVGIS